MKKYLLFLFFFVLFIGSAFAETEISYSNIFDQTKEEVNIGSTIFTLPNKYIVLRTETDYVLCGNRSTGEYIRFVTKQMSNVDLNSKAAIATVRSMAKEHNSTILKIERFDLNGKIIITTHEEMDRKGAVVNAYFFREGSLYLIRFEQIPMYSDRSHIENYEQSRNLLLFIINSAR